MHGTLTIGRRARRLAALTAALGLTIAAGLLVASAGQAVTKKQAKSTYGITTTTAKNGASKETGLKKPDSVKYSAGSYFIKASKIKRFKGWGSKTVSAEVGRLKICDDVAGKRKRGCSSGPGTITFDFLDSRRCKVGGRKKRVRLYGRTVYAQEATAAYPTGRGIGFQYGFPDSGQAADCPKI